MSLFLTGDLTSFEALCAAADDGRGHPEQDQLRHVGVSVMNEMLDAMRGTAFEDHVPAMAEAMLGGFQSLKLRLEREGGRANDKLRQLVRDNDGSEIVDVEMQEATRESRAIDAIIMAVEIIQSAASETYTVQTGETWSPWRGSVRRTASTIAQIDARDALRARKARDHAAADPGDQVVALRAAPHAKSAEDANRLLDALNWAKSEFPGMKLATTGAKGPERIAITWAQRNNVDVILCKVNFDGHGKAAPFRANDEMLAFDPVCVLTLANSLDKKMANESGFGPALNLGQKAEQAGLRHQRILAKAVTAKA